MDTPGNSDVRREILSHADLITAVRFPNNLFTENANTQVGSDLVILRKNSSKQALTDAEEDFLNTVNYAKSVYFNYRDNWNDMVRRGMAKDFSWNSSARQYEGMYDWMINW